MEGEELLDVDLPFLLYKIQAMMAPNKESVSKTTVIIIRMKGKKNFISSGWQSDVQFAPPTLNN